MKICGIKLTHDGCVALINNGKLEFSIEMEKLNNNPRFTSIEDTNIIAKILSNFGYSVDDIDIFSIDGWGGTYQDALAIQPRLEIGDNKNYLSINFNGSASKIGVAPYSEKTLKNDILEEWKFEELKLGSKKVQYSSYLHAAGHLMSTYCTSPFAKRKESSYVLIWDGGMYPRLYFIDPNKNIIENLGPLFLLIGNTYTIFSQHFGPFDVKGSFAKDNLSVAGKVMAYIALGKTRAELYEIFDKIYKEGYDLPMGFANYLANEFKKRIDRTKYSDEDILCSFHHYLEKLLVEKLNKKISRHGNLSKNICLSGGCALNIKWNSAVRNTGIYKEVYVPPFPNDSGSAIGAACCAMYKYDNRFALEWDVFKGTQIIDTEIKQGWKKMSFSIKQLAKLMHDTDQPVVFLNDRSELGPRALGNRSILASATSHKMKDLLNKMKKREYYRPVSPICIEEKAAEWFEPGIKDPFMLFDHSVKPNCKEKIPAVIHLDNTSRLQTVSRNENYVLYELLSEYEKLSGIPLLCNTSANFNKKGFFPDIYSAMEWGEANYVYCNNNLYVKENQNNLNI